LAFFLEKDGEKEDENEGKDEDKGKKEIRGNRNADDSLVIGNDSSSE
jgi:hypothetical protein